MDVNDLPCRIISVSALNKSIGPQGVVCVHTDKERYTYKLDLGEQALLVFKNKKYIASLFVGQGL